MFCCFLVSILCLLVCGTLVSGSEFGEIWEVECCSDATGGPFQSFVYKQLASS